MSDLAVPFEAVEAPAPAAPAAPELARAVVGFLALGVCAGLGASGVGTAARAVPSGLFVGVGALVLTGPALVVGHQYLGLAARPADLAAVLGHGFERAGRLALGLSPVMAFFSLTTGLWGALLALLAATIAAVSFGWIAAALRATEPPSRRMDALVVAWSGLAVLVALRLAVEAAQVVAGGAS